MELISRSLLNKTINKQFGTNVEYNQTSLYKVWQIKSYKKEGKTLLYKVSDVNSIGIKYKRDISDFYPIPFFEEKYWINKKGEVMNVYDEKIISSHVGVDGYVHITLRFYGKKYRKRVHSLMGVTFLGNPQVVNHKDGNKSNNNLNNLEKSTHSENIKHAYDNKYYTTRGSGGTSVRVKSKLDGSVYTFPSMRKAEEFTGVDRHRIKMIINKKNKNNTNWEFEF